MRTILAQDVLTREAMSFAFWIKSYREAHDIRWLNYSLVWRDSLRHWIPKLPKPVRAELGRVIKETLQK